MLPKIKKAEKAVEAPVETVAEKPVEKATKAKATPAPAPAPVEEEKELVQGEDFFSEDILPIFADEFAYQVKAGKGTFDFMSADDVLCFAEATLGKVDKIVITKM